MRSAAILQAPSAKHNVAFKRDAVPRTLIVEARPAIACPRLRRSCDRDVGYTRVARGDKVEYLDHERKLIVDEDIIARIKSLAIPPAYTDVWICTDPRGHLQATGRDARGRKQYRYHPQWRMQRDDDKFERLEAFSRVLPRLRNTVARDIQSSGLPAHKVTAAVVRLLDQTFVRIGGECYARDNNTFGLTTLCKRHVSGEGQKFTLRFKGKHSIVHEVTVDDRHASKVICACLRLPGRSLFGCMEDGIAHRVRADDVNRYLSETSGGAMTAKDFRTWGASVAALACLRVVDPPSSKRAAQRTINEALREVAALLGNTPAVCRKSYVHPAVIEAFADGTLAKLRVGRCRRGLSADEHLLDVLLTHRSRS